MSLRPRRGVCLGRSDSIQDRDLYDFEILSSLYGYLASLWPKGVVDQRFTCRLRMTISHRAGRTRKLWGDSDHVRIHRELSETRPTRLAERRLLGPIGQDPCRQHAGCAPRRGKIRYPRLSKRSRLKSKLFVDRRKSGTKAEIKYLCAKKATETRVQRHRGLEMNHRCICGGDGVVLALGLHWATYSLTR